MPLHHGIISARSLRVDLLRHGMRLALALGLGVSAAACTAGQPAGPFDVGNMAYPDPMPQGEVRTTAASSRTFDTGNMAYPTPLPQGNIATSRVR